MANLGIQFIERCQRMCVCKSGSSLNCPHLLNRSLAFRAYEEQLQTPNTADKCPSPQLQRRGWLTCWNLLSFRGDTITYLGPPGTSYLWFYWLAEFSYDKSLSGRKKTQVKKILNSEALKSALSKELYRIYGVLNMLIWGLCSRFSASLSSEVKMGITKSSFLCN